MIVTHVTVFPPSVTMYDYGEFVPVALKVSSDNYYRSLGNRLELYPSYDEAVFHMLNGTHAYIDSFTYNRILVGVHYKVGIDRLQC